MTRTDIKRIFLVTAAVVVITTLVAGSIITAILANTYLDKPYVAGFATGAVLGLIAGNLVLIVARRLP